MRKAVRPQSPIGGIALPKGRSAGHVTLIATPQPSTEARDRACLSTQLTVNALFRASLGVVPIEVVDK